MTTGSSQWQQRVPGDSVLGQQWCRLAEFLNTGSRLLAALTLVCVAIGRVRVSNSAAPRRMKTNNHSQAGEGTFYPDVIGMQRRFLYTMGTLVHAGLYESSLSRDLESRPERSQFSSTAYFPPTAASAPGRASPCLGTECKISCKEYIVLHLVYRGTWRATPKGHSSPVPQTSLPLPPQRRAVPLYNLYAESGVSQIPTGGEGPRGCPPRNRDAAGRLLANSYPTGGIGMFVYNFHHLFVLCHPGFCETPGKSHLPLTPAYGPPWFIVFVSRSIYEITSMVYVRRTYTEWTLNKQIERNGFPRFIYEHQVKLTAPTDSKDQSGERDSTVDVKKNVCHHSIPRETFWQKTSSLLYLIVINYRCQVSVKNDPLGVFASVRLCLSLITSSR
ncbi:hypothetical protein J6590_024500 [Homalodisca vitripennis]|nr:hypothetical protein J6590_024500 [Homalodisca vitripennis]